MRIAIDLRYAQGPKTGVGVYSKCLAQSLFSIDQTNEYYAFILEDIPYNISARGPNVTFWPTRVTGQDPLYRDFWQQFYLPYKLKREKIDVFYGPSYIVPCFSPCATVAMIHDMNTFLFSHTNSKLNILYARPLIWLSAKRATLIATPCNSSKNDIVRVLKVPEAKVRPIYSGVDDAFLNFKKDDRLTNRVKQKYGVEKDYVLWVGALNPRKNVATLLRAFKLFLEKYSLDYQLVVVGKKGWVYDEIFRTYHNLGFKGEVVFTGYVEPEELPVLYAAASLTVYPSIHEGFGFPILETMACRTPLVASNISSIPEVAGDAAILVDPYDIEALAYNMFRVLIDEKLREALITKGLKRARMFSWERTARQTLEVCQEAHTIFNRTGGVRA